MKSQLEIDVDLELKIHRVARRNPPNTLYERCMFSCAEIDEDNLNIECASMSRGCNLQVGRRGDSIRQTHLCFN